MANEDPDYLDWLRRQRCCVPGCPHTTSQAHHPREGVGLALKAHDHRAIPLCYDHHTPGIHRLTSGFFKGWTQARVREFCDRMAAHYRARYLAPPQGLEPIPF